MTRKCVLCKETNYRNTYSFFSAPKDPETRKKWQDAIDIQNYAVTDDTYVCSKHFHKNDIITHWVSGVPPHVITIKYKKCRLRPGAVPGRHYHLQDKAQMQENSENSEVYIGNYLSVKLEKSDAVEEKEVNFQIPRTGEKMQINSDEHCDVKFLHQQFSQDFNSYNYVPKSNTLNRIKLSENDSNPLSDDSMLKETPEQDLDEQDKTTNLRDYSLASVNNSMENLNPTNVKKRQNQDSEEDSHLNVWHKSLESLPRTCATSETNETLEWNEKVIKKGTVLEEKTVHNALKTSGNIYINKQLLENSSYDQLDTYYSMCNDIGDNELLFEDLLEVCTEVLLPRGWNCLVTSKGHSTTIVYLFMGMTKSGMPFTEKQVYIKSDMMLHCAAGNREINPLNHNLIREGKHLKIQSLLDIEELIDEFDQRTVCQGIYNTEDFQEIYRIKIAYKDGIKWRHILCPLILNNDSARCTKCIFLSHTLQCKLKKFPMTSQNRSMITKQQQKIQSIQQKYKRIRREVHRYEFIKIFKQ